MLLKLNTNIKTEEDKQQDIAIGIDLGTTNSVVTYFNNNKLEIIPIKYTDGSVSNLLPSVVKYVSNNHILIGKEALLNKDDGVTLSSIKRFMGKTNLEVANVLTHLPLLINNIEENNSNAAQFKVYNNTVTAIDVSTEILKFIKKQAENYIGKPVNKAVITVPAYFNENQRNATKIAANYANLSVLRLVNEPTAAALSYGLDEKIEGTFVIYDLGGGTFDVSILKLQKGIFKVLATGGNTALGGDDVDNILVSDIIETCSLKNINNLQKEYLLNIAKDIKHTIDTKDTSSIININNTKYEYKLTNVKYNKLIEPIIQQTITILYNVLKDAKIENFTEIDGVVLVGGSTRIKQINTTLTNIFKKNILCTLNPDEVVAIGAGHLAAILTGVKEDSVLLDVTPLSLGIEIKGGLVEKIIHRNTLIPIEKSQEFTTFKSGQTSMMIHILQGERELVQDLQSLGKFTLKGIPPLAPGLARVKVVFKLDMDGLLTVSATELLSGIQQSIEIKPHINLSVLDMRKMIEDSLEHGKEDIQKRLLLESITNATDLIDSLEKAIKTDFVLLINNEEATLKELILSIKKYISNEDRENIELINKKLIAASKDFIERRINRDLKNSLAGKNINDIK